MSTESILNPFQNSHPDILPDISVRKAMHWETNKILEVMNQAMATYQALGHVPINKLMSNQETPKDILRAISRGIVLVAENTQHGIIGTARLRFLKLKSFKVASLDNFPQLEKNTTIAYFTRFAVDQSFRGHGVGSLLLKTCEDIAREEGLLAMTLHTSISNESVNQFYLNRGYRLDSIDLSRGYPRGLYVKILSCN